MGAAMVCDSCREQFTPLLEEQSCGEIQWTFFTCPACGRKYTVSCTDTGLRDGIKEIQLLRAELLRQRETGEAAVSDEAYQRYVSAFDALKERIAALCEREQALLADWPLPGG